MESIKRNKKNTKVENNKKEYNRKSKWKENIKNLFNETNRD